jgi:glutamine amidotransferase
MKLTILDYGAGNLFSVARACSRLGYDPVLSSDRDIIAGSDKVIFPGVGNAVTAMRKIREEGLDSIIPTLEQPLLGICLGMQLLFEHSDEGDTPCLGIMEGRVKDFGSRDMGTLKVPHMGWNIIDRLQGRLFRDIPGGSFMYFVHSYYVPLVDEAVAASYYNGIFTAAVEKDNFFGCQFHPEKSGEAGIQILKNFLEL